MDGIFCANFLASRDGWPRCQQAWHAECYTCLGQGKFPLEELVDEEGNVWHTQEEREKRVNFGVKGAHLVVPFQCEICWLRQLEKRDPTSSDSDYIMYIRRVNLDAIAGRSKKTISAHNNKMARIIGNCKALGKTPSYPPRGPFPNEDCVGMGVAVDMQYESVHAVGRIRDHIQFSSLRHVRSTYTVSYQSSAGGLQEGAAFSKGKGMVRPTRCPTQSQFFIDFLRGCEYRMGSESRANQPISIRATVEILRRIRMMAADETESDLALSNYYYRVGAMLAVLTAGSLRGYEGFYVCLAGLRKHLRSGKNGVVPADYNFHTLFSEDDARKLPHVVITLLGAFKAENGSDYHMINVANVTTSGLQVRWWVEKLVSVCESEGRFRGPAFAGPDGKLESSLDYDATFREVAKEVQGDTDTEWIPSDLDVDGCLGLSRTPRKTAETRAKQAGVSTQIQDAMNRWRTVEGSKGKTVRWKATRDTYTSAVGEMPNTWRYSHAL
ncbi:hypothetical protein QTG54_014983 [Skeletonema marinoi]|uniref:Uncharacterized protein n=1 Tax=Skeletonema marinoi TaxID=267567 RepID=A0AAD9D4Y0_9STRA|nr:hypothetical protein QTG54_014983 [Skeletonema marinoi]